MSFRRFIQAGVCVGIFAILLSCGGGGGGGGASTPTTGSISGTIVVPGTTAVSTSSASMHATARGDTGTPQLLVEKAGGAAETKAVLSPLPLIPHMAPRAAKPAMAKVENPELHVTFVWRADTSEQRKSAILAEAHLEPNGAAFGRLLSFKVKTADTEAMVYERLRQVPEFTMLSVVKPVRTQFVPGDSYYEYQWDMKQMGMEHAWDMTRGSASVRVAVIDSGVQVNHEELAGRLVDGYDFISDPTRAKDGDGRDSDPSDDTVPLIGGHSHGTHVAGTIGANTGTSGSVGGSVVGVDHFCKIMPIRCLSNNSDGSAVQDVWDGLIYAGDLDDSDLNGYTWFTELFPTGLDSARPRPSQRADVINMSIGSKIPLSTGAMYIQIYNGLLAAAKAKGCTIVVAAGNGDENGVSELIETSAWVKMPAASPSVICVGATDPMRSQTSYSNYGSALSVMAPGGNTSPDLAFNPSYPESGGILSLNSSSTSYEVAWLQGTSMAAPHIAGVCSLMKAINPGLTPDQIKDILQNTALDLGAPGRDDLNGYGFVLADRAIAAAASVTPATQLIAYTGGLTFDGTQTAVGFTIGNAGGSIAALGSLSYSVTYGPGASGWITGSSITSLSANFSAIGVTISRTGLSDGIYTATFTQISTNGGNVAIPITLRVLSTPPPPAFTTVYALLINADTDAVVEQYTINLPSRFYTFSGIPPGRYYVVAGTDLNDDGYIDDQNEYFGIYYNAVEDPVFTVEAGVVRLGFTITLTMQGNPG